MAEFQAVWVDQAVDQYLTLGERPRARADATVATLLADPRRSATHDARSDLWTVAFDEGRGLIVFILNEETHVIVVLRVLHLS